MREKSAPAWAAFRDTRIFRGCPASDKECFKRRLKLEGRWLVLEWVFQKTKQQGIGKAQGQRLLRMEACCDELVLKLCSASKSPAGGVKNTEEFTLPHISDSRSQR